MMELREQIAAMCDSDSVKLRDIGVIAATLDALDDRRGAGEVIDYLDAAKAVIKAQTEAGLATFRLLDLQAFIADLKHSLNPERYNAAGRECVEVGPRAEVPTWEGGSAGPHTEACDGELHPGQACPVDYP
ncbi:hypothetical protein PHELEMICH_69 [Mycobacterium phage Phelemich]|uniref:Uncharacterized protein n=2 Tax=Acadianvirus reprobate TaxID=1982903 RepID=S5YR09_9CAUD|nr:hypothetical protein N847_gp69 [Mycobacterium phage Phelemich]YP_008409992.1 hypothetical protein REPROBATE_71 [Mycobacterium phage Reprobate]AGT12807.1 hypothetical protein REPROBATE_71 [Mycobacterium phage Reprobate]AGT13983.1 hypothetical protein PHELEMICH_69 [Mycobacterium phage Phelemich]